jgi:hypothetical protein
VGIDATVVGDPKDERIVWLDIDGDYPDPSLVWPFGYVAVFNPKLSVLNETGQVVFRQGDRVKGACTAGPNNAPGSVLRIEPWHLAS